MIPEKQVLLAMLLERVRADLASLIRQQQDSRDAATHGENRAEHSKDTRATEQSYLARGLADRVEALRESEARLSALPLRRFGNEEEIALTAVVSIEDADSGEPEHWWLVPGAGGIELAWASGRIRTLTPGSPLGRSLMGLQRGEEGSFQTPRGQRRFQVLEVG